MIFDVLGCVNNAAFARMSFNEGAPLMKKWLRSIASLLLVLCFWAQTGLSNQSSSVAITHVTLIDATGSAARPGMTVVITGDRIVDIGKDGKVTIPAGARTIDAKGKFLIPGLWDMHVHAFDKNSFFPMFVANGVIGVRDMFGQIPMINMWRKEMQDGTLVGPRFVASGPIVDGPKPIWPGSIAVSTPEEGVAAVGKVKDQGADFVKVYNLIPRDAYFAIAAEAKRRGMVFAGHVPNAVTVAEASDAGQKSIEHLTGLLVACSAKESEIRAEMLSPSRSGQSGFLRTFIHDQARAMESYDVQKARALAARFVKNGTWMSPTLTVLRAIAYVGDEDFRKDPRLVYMPSFVRKGMWTDEVFGLKTRTPEDNAIARRVFDKNLEVLRLLHKSGVPIIGGTDTPNPYVFPGFSLHDELELLVKAGLTPIEALQTVTRNAARYLGLPDTGTIEKGKLADLVLLDANPLQVIGNTRKINAVVIRGRLIERSELDSMLAKVEAANRN
jgi:imidazolonepropionase-like amidohydrolase